MRFLCVYSDGDCPICRKEVAFYQWRDTGEAIVWEDINILSDEQLPKGKSRAELLGRFHVLDDKGAWHIGVDAFAAIWQALPVFNRLAWVFATPGLRRTRSSRLRKKSSRSSSSSCNKINFLRKILNNATTLSVYRGH